MKLQEFLIHDNAEMIAPVGMSFGMRGRGADLFILEVIGDKDSPIRSGGRIIGLCDEVLCRAALEALRPLLPVGVKIDHKYDFICNISDAIKLVTEEDEDRDAVVLNCINTLLDLVATGPVELPNEYTILRALADRLTFHAEFAEFKQTRSLIRNALLWCAGITNIELTLVRSLDEFEALLPSMSANSHQ